MDGDLLHEADENSIIDVSTWYQHEFYNVGGTREKFLLEDSNGFKYYFKKSNENPGYIHEFWSEIVAYFLGQMLDMPVLKYDVAIFNNNIGCISKSMFGAEETLIEGYQLMQAYNPSFVVQDRAGQAEYTYQLIEKTLKWVGWSEHMYRILQIIIFDSIIGNQDRHQANWGFVIKLTRNSPQIKTQIHICSA